MQCPSCKEIIDDDSRYCDQCGEQILICSACGRPGKGKRCILDGKEMVPAGSGPSAGSAAASVPVPPVQPVQTSQPTQSPLSAPPVQAATAPVQPAPQFGAAINTPGTDKVKLTSQMHGIMIEAKDGDIIGRKNGAFANILGRFNFVSGTHCKLVKTTAGWHIQDLGSTNGTFYNGSKLAPNVLYPVLSNTMVKIADIELLVTYDTAGGGTSRL